MAPPWARSAAGNSSKPSQARTDRSTPSRVVLPAMFPAPFGSESLEAGRDAGQDPPAVHRAPVDLEFLVVEDIGAGQEDLEVVVDVVRGVGVDRDVRLDEAGKHPRRPGVALDRAQAGPEGETAIREGEPDRGLRTRGVGQKAVTPGHQVL